MFSLKPKTGQQPAAQDSATADMATLTALHDRMTALAEPYDAAAKRIDAMLIAARQNLTDAERIRDEGAELMIAGSDRAPSPRVQAKAQVAVQVAIAELSATEQTAAGMTKRLQPAFAEYAAAAEAYERCRRQVVAQVGADMIAEAAALRRRADLLESAVAGIVDYQRRVGDPQGQNVISAANAFDDARVKALFHARVAIRHRFAALAETFGHDPRNLPDIEVG